MSYCGDPNISNLSGSFGSLTQRKGGAGRERRTKGEREEGRKDKWKKGGEDEGGRERDIGRKKEGRRG